MEVKLYRLEELESHLHTSFTGSAGPLSMSPLRLASYLNNPRAEATDIVLIELHTQGELISYRTLLPDHFISRSGQRLRFAWLSGNWVHPDYRRKGISTRLLHGAEEAWDGRLMYTNYAPASKAVYDQSKSFMPVVSREGKRFYLRAASEELLGLRMGGSFVFRNIDSLINSFREKKLRRIGQEVPEGCTIERVELIDDDLRKIITQSQDKALFRRDAEVFQWAMDHPWVTHEKVSPVDYHFSYQALRFENTLLKFRDADTGSRGMLWLIQHNNVLSVPYVFVENKALYSHMAEYILKSMIRSGSTHTTLRCQDLINKLQLFKRHFLLIRDMPQHIFAHVKLHEQIPDGLAFQDGDGDVMFTG